MTPSIDLFSLAGAIAIGCLPFVGAYIMDLEMTTVPGLPIGAYHLAKKSGNFGLRSNGGDVFWKNFPEILDNLFGRGKTTKKEVFTKICAEFNAISDHKVTVEQCMCKWAKLEIKQKEIEDNNNQTGRP